MKRKIIGVIIIILSLGIVTYDLCAGDYVSPTAYVAVGLLVMGNLIQIFGKQKQL